MPLQDLLDAVEGFGEHFRMTYLQSRRSVVYKHDEGGTRLNLLPGVEAKEREKLSWSLMVLQCIAGHTSMTTASAVDNFLKWQQEESEAKAFMDLVVEGERDNQDQVSQERSDDVEY